MFSGAGFASLGFRKAGFEIVGALEINSKRCQIYEKNLHLKPIQEDVLGISAQEILSKCNLEKGSDFCVVGCPPCQSFSKLSSTRRINPLTDPRSKIVEKFADLISEMNPLAVVFENVTGMLSGSGKIFFNYYIKKLEKYGYFTISDVMNAYDFGVPQNRKRVVGVSIRKDLINDDTIEKLKGIHTVKSSKHKTVRGAISDLKPLSNGQSDHTDPLHSSRKHGKSVLEIIKHIPKNGGNRKDLPKRLWLNCHKKLKKGAETSYGRMWWDEPSPTITCRCTTPACGRFIHPSQNRGITLREAARLQTIPDSFDFGNNATEQIQSMIGDGVPVNMAKHIGKCLKSILT